MSDDCLLTTARLSLHRMSLDDAGFVLQLVNEKGFVRHIGDKGIRTRDHARRYIREVPMSDYARYGYGGYLVRRRSDEAAVGMCGLYRRENLDHPDLGFALLDAFTGLGFAFEASQAVLDHARDTLGLGRVAALAGEDNPRSRALIERLGFERRGTFRMADGDTPLCYYAIDFVEPACGDLC